MTGRLLVGGGLAVLGLAYVAVAWAVSDRVPSGTTVAGVPIGGRSEQAAAAELSAALQRRGGTLPVRVGDSSASIDLAAAGLALDPAATVAPLSGFSLNPVTLGRQLFGDGQDRPAIPAVSTPALRRALTTLGEGVATPAVNASVTFAMGTPVLGEARAGSALDMDAAVGAVTRQWLGARSPVALEVRDVEPAVTQAAAETALREIAEPAVSGPLEVSVGSASVSLTPRQFAPVLSLGPGPSGGLELLVDGPKLRKALLAAGDDRIGTAPQDARITFKGGKPVVVPGVDGVTIDPATVEASVLPALAAGGDRKATVKTKVTEPELTTAEARKLGVKERVSTFATILTADPLRTQNLRVAARTVNGTLVLPGETFSLNGVLGERTRAKGYHQAPAINGGRLVSDVGGGVSQMATTVFNNVFFAGLQDVYHKPHSFYISRYPEGREATVYWPSVDMKWRNDSEYAVLIQAWVDSRVHVSFWSTKTWDITAGKGPRTNYRTPKTVYDSSDGCIAQAPNTGFDVSVTRTFRRPGSSAVVKRQTFSATYIAEDRVVCGPEPKGDPEAND
jgi:vancomycin resistance protein YoaR